VTTRSSAALVRAPGGVANASGFEVYAANCAICHQPDGAGVAGVYPPLKESVGRYVQVCTGRACLVRVLSYGLSGTISVGSLAYSGFMQAWPQLGDADVADLLNHVLEKLNARSLPAHFQPFTAEEVKKLRGSAHSVADFQGERETPLKAIADPRSGRGS
jgi:mono/diheme cytochrome c family protein